MKIISKFEAVKLKESGEVNSGEYKLEVTKCPTLGELLKQYQDGYPMNAVIRADDEGYEYDDKDIENISSIDPDPDLTVVFDVAKDLSNKMKPKPTQKQDVKEKEETTTTND